MTAFALLNDAIHYMDIDSPRFFDYVFTKRAAAGLVDTYGDRYLLSNIDIQCTLEDMVSDLPNITDLMEALTPEIEFLIPYGKRTHELCEYLDVQNFHCDNTHRFIVSVNETILFCINVSVDVDYLAVAAVGTLAVVKPVVEMYKERYSKRRTINYTTLIGFGRDGPHIKENNLSPDIAKKMVGTDAFYPFIEGGIEKLAEEYAASNSPILLLLGEPGLGKTTLIRSLNVLLDMKENILVNDEETISNPAFMQYLHSLPNNCVISIEDAQNMLEKRSRGNRQMSSFLSFSDGIIANTNKIMISTNLTSLNSVDEPLYRPGRLFKYINFRKLTPLEANNARESIGLESIDFTVNVSLAEALNGLNMSGYGNAVMTKAGF